MLYRAESLPIDAQMTKLISSFGTSAYHIMTGVKRLDKVHNTTVLVKVSRNELIHTAYDHQLSFLGHMLRVTYSLHARTYALYQPTHGSTPRCGRPGTNYMDYIRSEKQRTRLKTERPGVNWWTRVLIHNHPTTETERDCRN